MQFILKGVFPLYRPANSSILIDLPPCCTLRFLLTRTMNFSFSSIKYFMYTFASYPLSNTRYPPCSNRFETYRKPFSTSSSRLRYSFSAAENTRSYVLRLDSPELKEMLSLLRRCNNNLNQVAKRANETGRIYTEDLEDLAGQLDKVWELASQILAALAKVE